MTTAHLEASEPKARPIKNAMRKAASGIAIGICILGIPSCGVVFANRYGIGAEYRAQAAAIAAQRTTDEAATKIIDGKKNPSTATCAELKKAIGTEIKRASASGVLKEPLTKNLHEVYVAKTCARS